MKKGDNFRHLLSWNWSAAGLELTCIYSGSKAPYFLLRCYQRFSCLGEASLLRRASLRCLEPLFHIVQPSLRLLRASLYIRQATLFQMHRKRRCFWTVYAQGQRLGCAPGQRQPANQQTQREHAPTDPMRPRAVGLAIVLLLDTHLSFPLVPERAALAYQQCPPRK